MQTHPSCGTKEYSQTEELDPIFSIHAQVAVDHLNMLVSLVEEMTCKWERQLEDVGEGRWDDDMLAKEGTEGERDGGPRRLLAPPRAKRAWFCGDVATLCVTWFVFI